MSARQAGDDEIERWRDHGWVLLEALVGTDEIDAALADLYKVFPTAEQYHADPEGETLRRLGRPPTPTDEFVWPDEGPGFRPDQHRWQGLFPFPGGGALNRLVVHPAIVDFAERALATTDLRVYQTGVSAKYTGITNYEQPMHTDRNHSWLPAVSEAPWWHVEGFLYLSDVDAAGNPTHLVSVRDSVGRRSTVPLIMPDRDPELYGLEKGAAGVRGSYLAYRPDVFHRAVQLAEPGGSRFLLNVSYRIAGQDWIGYHSMQSRSTSPDWIRFVENSTPRQLALFGFPPPGHPIWTTALVEATGRFYPKLDLDPWRAALRP
ncbi:MAG TPA: hypothetical protein VN816_07000 [Acidimicrobiales bacterium]|nr:hypothetical protein [Acidimicrobiales bacterium]